MYWTFNATTKYTQDILCYKYRITIVRVAITKRLVSVGVLSTIALFTQNVFVVGIWTLEVNKNADIRILFEF